jgi:hypothetical protein
MNKDDLLLSEAYARIQNEGTGARINYMGQGVGAAASNLWQGLKAKGANALAGKHVVDAPTQTAGQSYQAAGGKWLVDDFVKKAQAEITDFYNDAKTMGVDASNIDAIRQTHPEIADQLQKVTGLLDFLKGGGGQTPAGQTPAGQTPAGQTPAVEAPKKDPKSLEASTPSGTGPLTVQQPKTLATPEQKTGGVVQGIPHGVQRTSTGGGTTNTSFSVANPSQTSLKQVNKLPEEEPVQKAFTPPAPQDAEVVNDKEKQSTAGYVNSSEGQKTLGAPKAPQQPSQKQPEVDDTFTSPKGIKYTFQPTKNGDMWVDSKGRINTSIQRNLTSGWLKQQATKSNKGKTSK